jgi:hypothetical protein
MADLTIIVEVVNGQTLSNFSIPPSGKLVFQNAADPQLGDLVITPKPPATELPFCEDNGKTPTTLAPIPGGGGEGTVKICESFPAGSRFLYEAQIGTTIKEDPIVIIDKKKDASFDPLAAAILGASLGAAATYLIVKSRANKMRPQQG